MELQYQAINHRQHQGIEYQHRQHACRAQKLYRNHGNPNNVMPNTLMTRQIVVCETATPALSHQRDDYSRIGPSGRFQAIDS